MTQDELAIVEQVQHHPNIVKFSITEKKFNRRWKKVVEEEQRGKFFQNCFGLELVTLTTST